MKKNKNPNPEYFNKAVEIIRCLLRSTIMKKRLTVAFIVLCSISFAQPARKANQFDKFIANSSVEWAAYVTDKFRFEKDSLNKQLLTRLSKKEIKASLPVYYGINDADNIAYLSRDSIENIILYPSCILPQYDSNGNAPGFNREDFRDHVNIDSLVFTNITQILYIEKGKLKSYVPLVSPMRPVKTSQGVYLGDGDYFSTCFNFKYNYQPRKKSKYFLLAETTKKVKPDSVDNINKLKELYNRNLVETLWPYILEGKIEAFSVEPNTKLKKEEINKYLLNKTRIPVPTYDSAGTVSGFILPQLDFGPEEFTEVELIQDWYYNPTDNIVFNKIKAMYLYAKTPVADEEEQRSAPVLKIVFN